jgi:hypothetical protein
LRTLDPRFAAARPREVLRPQQPTAATFRGPSELTSKRKNSLLCPRRKATFVPKDYRDFYAALTAKNLRLCPECGIGIMIRIEILPPCHCPGCCTRSRKLSLV